MSYNLSDLLTRIKVRLTVYWLGIETIHVYITPRNNSKQTHFCLSFHFSFSLTHILSLAVLLHFSTVKSLVFHFCLSTSPQYFICFKYLPHSLFFQFNKDIYTIIKKSLYYNC